jgi:hypothetical protein
VLARVTQRTRGAKVQAPSWTSSGARLSPMASPNPSERDLSGVVWMGRNPLVQLYFPHSREGGDMSSNP